MMNLAAIQDELRQAGLDGWLFVDHHHRDPLAYRVLGLRTPDFVSRRWYYFIPADGEPRGLVHDIEPHVLDGLPGRMLRYARRQEHESGLKSLVDGAGRVAMQYSPNCAIPYVANVDAGTVEWVRSFGVEVASSADLIQVFEAKWTPDLLETHLEAGRRIDQIRKATFEYVGERTRAAAAQDFSAASRQSPTTLCEYDVQQFVLRQFAEHGLVTGSPPIVGVNANASDSHYNPPKTGSALIRRGDLLLLDLWAKLAGEDSVYYDVTWMAYCGSEVPERIRKVFDVVVRARDAGIEFIQEAIVAGRVVRGFEVDDVVRSHIEAGDLAKYIRGRTGHSIGREVHGAGANMDNTETHDERRIIPWTCFSIEPGLYLPDFGVRSEVNVFVDENGARVTGERQTQIVLV